MPMGRMTKYTAPTATRAVVGRPRRQYRKKQAGFARAVKGVINRTKETKMKVVNYEMTSTLPQVQASLLDNGWVALDCTPTLTQGDGPANVDGSRAYMKNMLNCLTFQGTLNQGYTIQRLILVEFKTDPTLAALGATPSRMLYRQDAVIPTDNFGINTPVCNKEFVRKVHYDRCFTMGPARLDCYVTNMYKHIKIFTKLNYMAKFNTAEDPTGRSVDPKFFYLFWKVFTSDNQATWISGDDYIYMNRAVKWSFKEV